VIDLSTIEGLHRRQHELHAYCVRCDRWSRLDLASLIDHGKGSQRLPLTVRCRMCDEVGQLQVRPPMPTRSMCGWIAPPVTN
jgi:hypothetical protein